MFGSQRHAPPPPKPSWWASWHGGQRAISTGTSLHDYLTWRQSVYERGAPPRHLRPRTVEVIDGAVVQRPNPEAQGPTDAPGGGDPVEAAMSASFPRPVERHHFLKDLERIEEERARVMARLGEVDEALDASEAAQQDALREGRLPILPAFPWGLVAGALVIVLVVMVESYQFAVPFWNMIGVDVTNLGAEWGRNPAGILAGSGFALATAAAIFLGWYWVMAATAALARRVGVQPWWRSAAQMLLPLGLGALLLETALGLGAMRHDVGAGARDFHAIVHGQTAAGQGSSTTVFVLLTLLVPLALAWLHHQHLQGVWQRWRQAHAQWVPFLEQRQRLTAQQHRLARQLARAEAALQQLEARALAREGHLHETHDAARREAESFVQHLVAALEQDRIYWLQAKQQLGAALLVHGGAMEPTAAPLAVVTTR